MNAQLLPQLVGAMVRVKAATLLRAEMRGGFRYACVDRTGAELREPATASKKAWALLTPFTDRRAAKRALIREGGRNVRKLRVARK